MKPTILVTTAVNDLGAISLAKKYVTSILNSGGIALVLPYLEDGKQIQEYADMADGFLFTGGCDIEPSRYGEEKKETCGEIEPLRDEIEYKLFDIAYKTGKPILAICRGAQLVNCALGGTLYQDLPTECDTIPDHRGSIEDSEYRHTIKVVEGTPLYSILGCETVSINTYHHQAAKTIGSWLQVMARSEDGVVEAIYSTEHPYIRGYQWHPERMYDSDAGMREIFNDFIEAAKK